MGESIAAAPIDMPLGFILYHLVCSWEARIFSLFVLVGNSAMIPIGKAWPGLVAILPVHFWPRVI